MNFLTKYPARSGLISLVIFFLMSMFFIFEYAKKERTRDLMDWQVRLNILAEMRVTSVESWLEDRRSKLTELANNPTLKLYLSQYNQFDADADDVAMQAQFSHVKNLLHAASSRFGFSSKKSGSINTEQELKTRQGFAVLSEDAKLLFSTKGFYSDLSKYQDKIKKVLVSGEGEFVDFFKADSNHLLYGFALPVFHIQKTQYQKPVGAVLVLMDPVSNLYGRLENIHLDTKTDESLLARKSGEAIEFLSPLRNGLKVLHKIPKESMWDILEQQRELNVGNDYLNKEVLSISRSIDSTPWVLIQKIDAHEALQESDEHQQYLFGTFSLISMLLVSMFVAVWRHSTSVRLLKITNDLESRTALLDAVSDNINEHIFLIDENQKFVFVNCALAKSLCVVAQDMYGKKMASVLGPEVAKKLQELSFEKNKSDTDCVIALLLGDKENIYHVSSFVLQKGEYKNARLFVLHDITGIKNAQEKRDRLSKGIISTLVKAVDLHDPYCVNHSERTREVALDIAHELGLAKEHCEALEMAALLANIGKLFVPKEILTKMDVLTEEESQTLRKNIAYAVDVLKELEFEGPVVDIISQKNESLDGSGYPNGLKEGEIMLQARILAVSNALVAMTSSRAYRQGKPIKEVINILLEQSDVHYDRQVVAALFHIAENKSDWHKWQNVTL